MNISLICKSSMKKDGLLWGYDPIIGFAQI